MSQKTLPASAFSNNTADYARGYFHAVVDDSVTLDDLLTPAFWAHHTRSLTKMTLVDVVRQDMTLDVQLRVIETGIGYVRMRPLRVFEDEVRAKEMADAAAATAGTDADEVKLPAEYKITTAGKGGFTLTFVPSDAKIGEKIKTEAAAVQMAKDHAAIAGIAWPEPAPAETPPGT